MTSIEPTPLGHRIRCHLSRLMGERKVRIADVARGAGVHRNTLTLLYNETAKRIDLLDLEKLCRYFNVPVGELLEVIDETESPKA